MERQTVAKVQKSAPRISHVQRQSAHHLTLNTNPILGLQRSLGNAATQRLISSSLIQTKLQVSQPGDPFEKEADQVANTVMRMPEPPVNESLEREILEGQVPTNVTHVQHVALETTDEQSEKDETSIPESTVQRVPLAVREDDDLEKIAATLENTGDTTSKLDRQLETADRNGNNEIISAKLEAHEDEEDEKVAPKLESVPVDEPAPTQATSEPTVHSDFLIHRQTKDEEQVETESATAVQREVHNEQEQRHQPKLFSVQSSGSTKVGSHSDSAFLQRLCANCEGEHEREKDQLEKVIQKDAAGSAPPLADSTSSKSVSELPLRRQRKDEDKRPAHAEEESTPIQRQKKEEDEKLQRQVGLLRYPTTSHQNSSANLVRRLCAECESEKDQVKEQEAQVVTRQAGTRPTHAGLNPTVVSTIHSLKGGGRALPNAARAFFEPRFGTDFSDVRIHTDSSAAHAVEAVNARAFTVGRDIAFATGQYSPQTYEGQRLLAHELTHTLQQTGRVSPSSRAVATRAAGLDEVIQRDSTTPAPAPGVTPPSPPPPGTAPPANKETDTGLVYITIPHWTLMDKKSKTIKPIPAWSTDVPLFKVPIPELGAVATMSFEASFGAELTGSIGPIVLTNLTLGMTKLTAVVLGGSLILTGAALPVMGPGSIGILMSALSASYITGFGQLDAPGEITAKISAEAKLKGGLDLLGTEKLEVAGIALGLKGGVEAKLTGNASGRTQVTLDDGHLTWKKAAILSAGAELEAKLIGFLEARILFGLFKARLNKEWKLANPKWSAYATKPIGDEDLVYDWPSFKDEDKILTIKEETIKGVMNFVKDLLKDDKDPGKVDDKQRLPEHGQPDNRTAQQKQEAVDKAIAESESELNQPDATAACVEGKLPAIKSANRLTSLTLIVAGEDMFFVEAVINPIGTTSRHKLKKEPAVCQGVPPDPAKDSTAQLSLAKSTFKVRHWVRQELEDLLGVSETTAKDRIRAWRDAKELFALETSATDPFKAYNFDETRAGERPLKDDEPNRSKYGFKNPPHDSPQGYKILAKGLRRGSKPPSDPESRYDSMLGGKRAQPPNKYVDFARPLARLGHGPLGASEFWNAQGHKQSFDDNRKWNLDSDNYWGPEHKEESDASGASAPRYLVPMKAIGSHSDWF